MFWICPGHYKVHVYGWDSPGRPVHGHCPVPLPALTQAARRERQVPRSPESPANFWYELGLATQ